MKATDPKKETPRERIEAFTERRREDVGEFVSQQLSDDGYVQIQFERGTYFTPPDGRAVYRGGNGYTRPALKN